MEQPNHLRRSDQGPKKRDDELQHHYSNNRHKDDYEYGGKRNGYDGFGRGRGGRGGNGIGGMRGDRRGGGDRDRDRDHYVRNSGPKKIILPPKERTNKRPSDDEVEEVSNSMQHVAVDPINNHGSGLDDLADVELQPKQMTPENEKPEMQPQQDLTSEVMVGNPVESTGWFAPRGQPSRRGRGGISGPMNHRAMNKNDGNLGSTFNDDDGGRESSDDEEKRRLRNKDDRRGMNVGRGGIRKDDDRDHPDYRNPRRQNSQSGKMDMGKRGPPPPPVAVQQSKQLSYERRQNKLPPRLAKQKEQNRMKYGGKLMSTFVEQSQVLFANSLYPNDA